MFKKAKDIYKQINHDNVKKSIKDSSYYVDGACIFNNDIYNFKRLTDFDIDVDYSMSDEDLKIILNEIKAEVENERKIKKEQRKK